MRISVAMCTFNGALHLYSQLSSIAQQSRLPDEIVICDDGSSDETLEILDSFSRNSGLYTRIFVSKTTLGTRENFSKAISLCSGDVIALSDQDDVWNPMKLATLEQHFSDDPSLGALFSNAELINQHSESLGRTLWDAVEFDSAERMAIRSGKGLERLIQGNFVTGATLAFRASWKTLLLPIPSGWIHDHWIATLLSAVSKIDFDTNRLIKYRVHPSQQIGVQIHKTGKAGYHFLIRIFRRLRNSHHTQYLQASRRGNDVATRLKILAAFDCSDAIVRCQYISAHHELRGRLPRSKLKRIFFVAREALSGNYFLYSKGIKSILRDLI